MSQRQSSTVPHRRANARLARAMALWFVCVACGKSAPSPPTITPPSTAETITGTERIGWDQPAGDAAELVTIRYAIYVDGARSELSGVSCANSAAAPGYACSGRLPALTAGNHTLEIASFVQDGAVLESARSAVLRVTVTGASSSAPTRDTRAASQFGKSALAETPWPANAATVVEGLDRPADLAVTPGGSVLIAERAGRVRVVREGALIAEPALILPGGSGAVLALAIDPQFARTHFVFAIYTAQSRSRAIVFRLARFREAAGTMADEIVLFDDVPASFDPHASLRFGPDGKLYAAFDDGGDARLAEDRSRLNGKVLRLNPDGTTPDDQPRQSPILLTGISSPRGLDWHLRSARLWSTDARRVGAIRWTAPPSSIVARGDDLYVGSDAGLVRTRIDDRNPDRLVTISDVIRGTAVRAVTAGHDGTIFFATDSALGALR
jgi:hypothetical protein